MGARFSGGDLPLASPVSALRIDAFYIQLPYAHASPGQFGFAAASA
jgi:hypothetical protein